MARKQTPRPGDLLRKPRLAARVDPALAALPLSTRYNDTPEAKRARKTGSIADYAAATGSALKQAPGAIADIARATPAAAEAVVRYARSHTPRQVANDALDVGASAVRAFREHPLSTTADLLPIIGDIRAMGDTIGKGADLRAQGDPETAQLYERYAIPIAAAGLIPEVGGLAVKAGRGATRGVARAARGAEDAALVARPEYVRSTEGPFTVVARRGIEDDIRTSPAAADAKGMAALHAIAMDPAQSPAREVANRASLAARGQPYDFNAPRPVSSLRRQAGIGRAYQAAVEDAPGYKHATFERIGETMPQVVEQAKAQNLDQLTEAAYRQLGDEVGQQFDQLPVRTRYHGGEGEYASPNAMMRDVLGNGNLNVFSGGEPHEFLSRIDPATGLSQNEMFRAVHDYMGHVVPGSMFGAPGEEVAYAAHSQTLSPLAQLALLSETRGQNSWVNYSPANAEVIGQLNSLKALERERKQAESWLAKYPGDRWEPETRAALDVLPSFDELRAKRHELGQQFQYAPQRAVMLPPEYLDPMTPGGVPDWLQSTLSAKAPTNDVRGVHFSRSPDLAATDPSYYGSGARSGELPMVRAEGLPKRTYFYSGPEGTVRAEPTVGQVTRGVYEAQLNNLYDLQSDPEGLVRLAKAYNLGGHRPTVPGILAMNAKAEPSSATPDIERLVRDYGYSGFLTDLGANRRAAAVYDPVTGLRKIGTGPRTYADGGAV